MGGYNHGPCRCEVGFVTLCLLLQLKIYYSPHYSLYECWMYCPALFSAVTLCQIFFCSQCLSGRLLKGSSLVLLLFYTAHMMLNCKLFWYFSSSFLVQGEKRRKKERKKERHIYINNSNNYNCNKQKPRTISVGVQCSVSAVWTNLPVARKI